MYEVRIKYLRFGIIRIINLRPVIPIFRLLGFWVRNLLGWKEVPVIF